MADQRLLDPPGWARLVAAGRVDPPDAAVVERVRRQVALAEQQERIRMLLPVAVPLVRRRRQRRRLLAIAALAIVAASTAILISTVTSDGAARTVALAAGAGGAPALVPAEWDSGFCATGEGRDGEPATDLANLGYLSADRQYQLDSLLIRETRWNCPAYSPSLALVDVADDGRLLRYLTVYGPLAAPPWQTSDPAAGEIGTEAEITEILVHGRRGQLLEIGSPGGGTSVTAVWTDPAGRGWTATSGGVPAVALEDLLDAMTFGSAGARLDAAESDGMAVTSYESAEPEQRWEPRWRQEYSDAAGTTYSVETFDRGNPAGSVPWEAGIRDRWLIDIRSGTPAHLAVWDNAETDDEVVTATLRWQETASTWIWVTISPSDEDKLITFAESLAKAGPGDPRLDQAE